MNHRWRNRGLCQVGTVLALAALGTDGRFCRQARLFCGPTVTPVCSQEGRSCGRNYCLC
jgi:hypothetical protein